MSQFKKYMNLINEMENQEESEKYKKEIEILGLDEYVPAKDYYSIIPFYIKFKSDKIIPEWNEIRNIIWRLFPRQDGTKNNKTFVELKELIELSYLKYLEDNKASREELETIIKETALKKSKIEDSEFKTILKQLNSQQKQNILIDVISKYKIVGTKLEEILKQLNSKQKQETFDYIINLIEYKNLLKIGDEKIKTIIDDGNISLIA